MATTYVYIAEYTVSYCIRPPACLFVCLLTGSRTRLENARFLRGYLSQRERERERATNRILTGKNIDRESEIG